MTIVLCSKGYPGKYVKNLKLDNLEKLSLSKKDYIYHAGTIMKNQELFSAGGRVLNITSLGDNFFNMRKRIINIIKKINWKHGFYRNDIGWRIIGKNENN